MLHATILHRKPRTRRDRALAQLRAAPHGAERRWKRFRHDRQRRALERRAQNLFTQLGQTLEEFANEPATPRRHLRLRLRHHH